jgi:hypothetical protein
MNRPLWASACALLAAIAAAPSVRAASVSTTATADSIVDAIQPTTAFPTGDLIAYKEGTTDALATGLKFFYAQFDLPSGVTGQTMTTVDNVQFKIVRSSTASFSLTYYVYGVFDGLDTTSANSYTWNSGVGYDPANKDVKFLGANEISYYVDPAKGAFVGTLDTPTAGTGVPFDFTSTPQSPTAVAALKDLILNDTDGRITLYVGVRQPFGVTNIHTFASIENGNLAGPVLSFDYTVPEPASCGLLASGLLALVGLRRRAR